MAVTVDAFREIFPEFADDVIYPDIRVQFFLDFSTLFLNEDCWDDFYDMGIYYLTAHRVWVARQTELGGGAFNGAGPRQAETVDKVSYSNQSITIDDNWKLLLSATPYGLQYLEMLDLIKLGCSYLVINDVQ